MKRFQIISYALCSALFIMMGNRLSFAQEEKSNFSIGTDLVSRYIWRGLNLGGPSPHIQPYAEYSFGNSGVALGVWGSQSLGGIPTGAELDLYISYTPVEFFSFGFTDYFFPSDEAFGRGNYFEWDKDVTGHTLEAFASFNGLENLPLSVLFAINIFGADGTNENGDNYFAKYLEIAYSASVGNFGVAPYIGFALDNPDTANGAAGWYGNDAGIINLGVDISREIPLSESFTLPLATSLIFNPEANNAYLVFSIGFAF